MTNLRAALNFTPDPTPQELLRRAISTHGLARLICPIKVTTFTGSDALFELLEYDQAEDAHLVSGDSIEALREIAPDYFAGAQLRARISARDLHSLDKASADKASVDKASVDKASVDKASVDKASVVWLVSTTMPSNNRTLNEAIAQHSLGRAQVKGALYRAHKAQGGEAYMWRCSAHTSARLKGEHGPVGQALQLELAPAPKAGAPAPQQRPVPLAALEPWHHTGWQRDGLYLSLEDVAYLDRCYQALRGHSEGAVTVASLSWVPHSRGCDILGTGADLKPEESVSKITDVLEKILDVPEGFGEFTTSAGLLVSVFRRGQGVAIALNNSSGLVKKNGAQYYEDRRVLQALLLRERDKARGMRAARPTFAPVEDPAPQIWAGILELGQTQRWRPVRDEGEAGHLPPSSVPGKPRWA